MLGANILSIKDAVQAGIVGAEVPMYLVGVAVAAVTPPAVPPLITSRLPAVSFISAILFCKTATYTLSSEGTRMGAMESAPRFPLVCTKGLVQSAYSFSFTAPSERMKNRGVAAASVFFRMAWFIRSICFCADLHRSTYPYPQGVPSSGNSTSNTNGYFPWSYQPRSAISGSFSVAYSTSSPTNLQYCSTCRPSCSV